jgi:hypothetical protein
VNGSGAAGPWTPYGGNADTAADFKVTARSDDDEEDDDDDDK